MTKLQVTRLDGGWGFFDLEDSEVFPLGDGAGDEELCLSAAGLWLIHFYDFRRETWRYQELSPYQALLLFVSRRHEVPDALLDFASSYDLDARPEPRRRAIADDTPPPWGSDPEPLALDPPAEATDRNGTAGVTRDDASEARDRFIYDREIDGTPRKETRAAVNGRDGWGRLESDNGVKFAARSYAARHQLPPPPPRK